MITSLPRHRTVADVMTVHVHVAGPQTPFKLLVRLIEENRISAVPIVDQTGVPIGVVSEADLLQPGRGREKPEGLIAADLMTSPPITVPATIGLSAAARLMQERNVRRLVVVDGRGKIAGIVTRSDLLQVFLRSDEEIRHEITDVLIPAVLLDAPADVHVDVRWNVVTFTGEIRLQSDAEILTRMTAELDGVVGVVDKMSRRWDDATAV